MLYNLYDSEYKSERACCEILVWDLVLIREEDGNYRNYIMFAAIPTSLFYSLIVKIAKSFKLNVQDV